MRISKEKLHVSFAPNETTQAMLSGSEEKGLGGRFIVRYDVDRKNQPLSEVLVSANIKLANSKLIKNIFILDERRIFCPLLFPARVAATCKARCVCFGCEWIHARQENEPVEGGDDRYIRRTEAQ